MHLDYLIITQTLVFLSLHALLRIVVAVYRHGVAVSSGGAVTGKTCVCHLRMRASGDEFGRKRIRPTGIGSNDGLVHTQSSSMNDGDACHVYFSYLWVVFCDTLRATRNMANR